MNAACPMISVIIPTLNEAPCIAAAVAAVRIQLPAAEIIVVDGGSSDDTALAAAGNGARVVPASRGRGAQCRAGAEVATGDWLLFLHADTALPANAAPLLAAFSIRNDTRIATFRLAFDDAGWFLRGCAWCSRIDSVFTRFGDQGIFVRLAFYDELGGFPAWPLFEDVELLRRARRVTKIWSLPAAVVTSARRFRRRGPVRQQMKNAWLLLNFLLGVAPEKLAAKYRPEQARDQFSTP